MLTSILGRGEVCGDGGSGADRHGGKGLTSLNSAGSVTPFQIYERENLDDSGRLK